ncbi:MAG: acetyltransferase [Actinomycetia bacterium]|nr:acetyltransferase [Actinomycetes bacterium]
MHPTLTLRPAIADDLPELIRLREVMWTSMGMPLAEDGWREQFADVVGGWLRAGAAVAVVVEDPDAPGRLVACGIGSIDQHLPGSSNPTGRYGYIANMVTEEAYRGRGLAGQVLRQLLEWFQAQGVRTVDLHASAQGEPIYRAAGFTENGQPALRWRST